MILGPTISCRYHKTFKQPNFAITEKKCSFSSHIQFCVSFKVRLTHFLSNFALTIFASPKFLITKESEIFDSCVVGDRRVLFIDTVNF